MSIKEIKLELIKKISRTKTTRLQIITFYIGDLLLRWEHHLTELTGNVPKVEEHTWL